MKCGPDRDVGVRLQYRQPGRRRLPSSGGPAEHALAGGRERDRRATPPPQARTWSLTWLACELNLVSAHPRHRRRRRHGRGLGPARLPRQRVLLARVSRPGRRPAGLHRGRLSVHVRARPGAGLGGLLRAPVGSLPTDLVPHEGFASLRKWAARTHLGAFVFTSNVDGQFQKAGFDANSVHE